MPRRRSQSTQRAIVLGLGAVVIALVVVVGLSYAVGKGGIDVANLGDRHVWVGNADRLADRVAKDGPFILPDVSPNKKRVIFVQHLGRSDKRGWFAILAGTGKCPLEWTGKGFTDTCSGRSYPADGTGRTRYRTWVEKNALYVDLRKTIP
jgi:hypothetical protein